MTTAVNTSRKRSFVFALLAMLLTFIMASSIMVFADSIADATADEQAKRNLTT